MKMKSKFFGLSAKLALAILAVGTTLTSCYDSENGDVTKPYVAPDPVYTISGTITNALTGEAIDATVTVNGTAATCSDGTYSAKGQAGSNTVTVSKTGFKEVTRNVTVAALEKGQASTTVVNVALTPNELPFDINDVKVTLVSSKETTVDKILTAADNVALDLTADENAAEFVRSFTVVTGADTTEPIAQIFADAPQGLLDYANGYLGAIIGQVGKVASKTEDYTISIAPYYCVTGVTITYALIESVYKFEYDNEAYEVTVKAVKSYTFSTQFLLNHGFTHSHGHGHGHGHGENLNAGGGIITPEL